MFNIMWPCPFHTHSDPTTFQLISRQTMSALLVTTCTQAHSPAMS